MTKTKKLIKTTILLCFLIFGQQAFAQKTNSISFPERGFVSLKAATQWENALLTGNGKYGALVFGQPLNETIVLNHARLFMPVNEPLIPVNTGAHLTEIRRMITDGKYKRATEYVVEISKTEGYAEKRWTDPFIPAFNIRAIMKPNGKISDYYRSVDFSSGVASVNWSDERGSFQRKLFVSRADDAVVLSITGKKGTVDCTLKLAQQPAKGAGGWGPEKMLKDGINGYQTGAVGNWLTFRSNFKKQWKGSLQGYEGVSRVVVRGGKTITKGDSISVLGADEVLVFTKIELLDDYENSKIEILKNSLSPIMPDFKVLLERHAKIHGAIFNRSRLDLGGGSDRNLTSEELISKSRIGSLNPALLEKEYDAARYNILSSSGELFPNLQGIWSGTYGPYWSGDFTLNGNVQSAISANLSANMAECMLPFFSYMEDHLEEFRENAKMLYNCRGINVPSRASNHCLKNCFEAERPMTFWTAGAGWVSQFFYEYYLYTGDKDFLRKRALPFMKEAALFYEDFLIEGPDGRLLFSPSYSPENQPSNSNSSAAINSAMDIGVARELLNNCIAASEILGVGNEHVKRWKSMLKKMPDYLINDKGAVKEWSTPLLEDNDAHRHASHLYALFNGLPEEIAGNPTLVKAFDKTLENRMEIRRREFMSPTLRGLTALEKAAIPNYTPSGDNGEVIEGRPPGEMAFGIVQQGFAAASLHKSDVCGQILDWLANCYWFPNFISTHNPKAIFNTDISGGLPALILRMLVDSQPGWIELMPAWPKTMPAGNIEGAALRGQIILKKLSWNGKKIEAVLFSGIQQNVQLRTTGRIDTISGNRKVKINLENGKYFLILPEKQEVSIKIELK
jgi:alpha-L-fucosidase 2